MALQCHKFYKYRGNLMKMYQKLTNNDAKSAKLNMEDLDASDDQDDDEDGARDYFVYLDEGDENK